MSRATASDLRELYQEFILDHARSPRNRRVVAGANRRSVGENPLCGDRIVVRIQVGEDGRIEDIGFQGQGCAISTAAASTMTEAVKGMDAAQVRALFERYHALVTGAGPEDAEGLDKLGAFAGVAEFPMRVKCATLAWHALLGALIGGREKVSTE